MRVVARKEGDPLTVERLEAGGRVGDALADDARHHPREQADADATRARGAVAVAVSGEAGADDDVGLAP